MAEKGIITVVSGFSGAGKGTLMNALLTRYEGYALSISATTRSPREGERNGKEYFFVTRERFEEMIGRQEFYEYAEYQGNYYGTPRKYVDEKLSEGKNVLLEIEVQGAEHIRQIFPDSVLVFVAPPDAAELQRRLAGRGTESDEKIRGRLARAAEEALYMPLYDYVLINDDLSECVEKLRAITAAEHARTSRNKAFMVNIKNDLEQYTV